MIDGDGMAADGGKAGGRQPRHRRRLAQLDAEDNEELAPQSTG